MCQGGPSSSRWALGGHCSPPLPLPPSLLPTSTSLPPPYLRPYIPLYPSISLYLPPPSLCLPLPALSPILLVSSPPYYSPRQSSINNCAIKNQTTPPPSPLPPAVPHRHHRVAGRLHALPGRNPGRHHRPVAQRRQEPGRQVQGDLQAGQLRHLAS